MGRKNQNLIVTFSENSLLRFPGKGLQNLFIGLTSLLKLSGIKSTNFRRSGSTCDNIGQYDVRKMKQHFL
jgi:hypothetical protein